MPGINMSNLDCYDQGVEEPNRGLGLFQAWGNYPGGTTSLRAGGKQVSWKGKPADFSSPTPAARETTWVPIVYGVLMEPKVEVRVTVN